MFTRNILPKFGSILRRFTAFNGELYKARQTRQPDEYRYRAFISYSHKDSDVVNELYGRLSSWRAPPALRKQQGRYGFPPRYLSVFVDRKSQESGGSLSSGLRSKLEQSAFLIVICSPAVLDDDCWVQREIDHFLKISSADRIIPVLMRNDKSQPLAEVFPSQLLSMEENAPIGADLLLDGGIIPVVHKVIGGLTGFSQDDIAQEQELNDNRQKRNLRRTVFAFAALSILVAAAGMFAYFQRNVALLNESRFLTEQSLASTRDGMANDGAELAERAIGKNSAIVSRPEYPQARYAYNLAKSSPQLTFKEKLSDWPLTGVRFSADNKTVYATSSDGRLIATDIVSKRVQSLPSHVGPINSISEIRNGRFVTASEDGSAIVWSEPDYQQIQKIEVPNNAFIRTVLSPDGQLIAAALRLGEIIVFDVASGNRSCVLQGTSGADKLIFSSDSNYLYVGLPDGKISKWDMDCSGAYSEDQDTKLINTGYRPFLGVQTDVIEHDGVPARIVRAIYQNSAAAKAGLLSGDIILDIERLAWRNAPGFSGDIVNWSPVFDTAIIGSPLKLLIQRDDARLIFEVPLGWRLERGLELISLRNNIADFTVEPELGWLAAVSISGEIAIYNPYTSETRKIEHEERASPISVSIFPSVDRILVTFGDGQFKTYALSTLAAISAHRNDRISIPFVNYVDSGHSIILTSKNGVNRIWDAVNERVVGTLKETSGEITSVDIDETAMRLASVNENGFIHLWDIRPARSSRLNGLNTQIEDAAIIHREKHLVTVNWDGYVDLWDLHSGVKLASRKLDANLVVCSPRSFYGKIAVGAAGGEIFVLDAKTLNLVWKSDRHDGAISGLIPSENGRRIYSHGMGNEIMAWNTNTGTIERQFAGHTGRINDVALNSDGKLLISGADDNSVIIWDTATGEAITEHANLNHGVQRVGFAPGTDDAFALLWNGDLFASSEHSQLLTHVQNIFDKYSTLHAIVRKSGVLVLENETSLSFVDIENGNDVAKISLLGNRIEQVTISPDQLVVAGSTDKGVINLWNIADGELIQSASGIPSSAVKLLSTSKASRVIYIGHGTDNLVLRTFLSGPIPKNSSIQNSARESVGQINTDSDG